jgi:hypothetical protein
MELFRSLQDRLCSFTDLEARFTLPAVQLEGIDRIQEDLRRSFDLHKLIALSQQQPELLDLIQASAVSFSSITNHVSDLVEAAKLPFNRMADSLAHIEACTTVSGVHESWVEAAVRPAAAFHAFISEQRQLMDGISDSLELRNRLEFTNSAAGLLEEATRAVELSLLMTEGEPAETPFAEWEVNLFSRLGRVVRTEDFAESEFDAEERVEQSHEARIVELGQRIVRLVYDLNTEAELEGRERPFKPTNKGLRACMMIPTHVAIGGSRFGTVVDQLYFLLYEGSGDAKRLTSQTAEDRLNPLWCLKHLRLGFRHDLDHGGHAGSRKKSRQVGEAFRGLIGMSVPRSSQDWCRAQIALYERLVEMLELIWFGVDGEGSEPSE